MVFNFSSIFVGSCHDLPGVGEGQANDLPHLLLDLGGPLLVETRGHELGLDEARVRESKVPARLFLLPVQFLSATFQLSTHPESVLTSL